jgi:hypothetical protein
MVTPGDNEIIMPSKRSLWARYNDTVAYANQYRQFIYGVVVGSVASIAIRSLIKK